MFTVIFSAAFIVFLILAAIFGLIKSRKYTLTKSLAKIIIAILSVTIAIIPSSLASWYIAKPISGKTTPLLGASMEDIIRDAASLGDVITLVVAAVLVSEFGDGSDMDPDNVKQFIDQHRTNTEK